MILDPFERYKLQLNTLALQLVDEATLFSKKEVIKEYEKNKDSENIEELLHNKAVYPNGEKLGFYNISEYSLSDFYEDKLSDKEWWEYINGFSSQIRGLFNLLYKYSPTFMTRLKPFNKKIVGKRENITDYFINSFDNLCEKDISYINYIDLSELLVNTLFEGIDFEKKISILHINPQNLFLISCLNHIRNRNPECEVELYAITRSITLTFALDFLSIINKGKFKFVIEENDEINHERDYEKLFDYQKEFDFIVNADIIKSRYGKIMRRRNKWGNYPPDYGVNVSSRAIYIVNYSRINLLKEWLEEDLLEALILIPYKNIQPVPKSDVFKLVLLVVLNYKKSEEKKNKFLVVDNNENKEITAKEYSLEDYRNLVNTKNVFRNTYEAFSKFANGDFSKIFDVNDFLNHRRFNFNAEMYDIKMRTQKKYYKTEHIKDKERIIKPLNYKTEKLGNLVCRMLPRDEKIIEKNKCLFLSIGNLVVDEQWAFLNYEIINPEQYQLYQLHSDKVLLEYLYYYLNSQIGINEYNFFVRGQRLVQFDFLEHIRVPIPPKNIQKKIVEAMNAREDFLNEVKLLINTTNNNFFDYKRNKIAIDEFYGKREYSEESQKLSMPDNWIYTYSGLVWPLAITYLIATSGGFEKVEKANNLLRLFEFTTAFNTIVLISGIPDEVYEKHKHKIWKKAYGGGNNEKFVDFYKLSFGSWVTFHYKLKKIYSKKFDTEINKEFYKKLLNNDIIEYYKTLKDQRNDEFHEGITNSYEAESLINELNKPKAKIFNYLNECYDNFRLYYITGKHDSKTNEHEVIFLNGPYSMPIYSTIIHEGDLESESLYLFDDVGNKMCKLNDKLIKFIPLDDEKHDWRLYIFIGFEEDDEGKQKSIYKCYQRKEDELEVYFDLKELM